MSVYKPEIQAVIFDNDGTVLDTLNLYYIAMTKLVPPPYPQSLVDEINGRSDLDVARAMIKHYNLDTTPEAFAKKRLEILDSLLPTCKTVKGVERIINKIHEMGIPMAVATSSCRSAHEAKIINHNELFSNFVATICGDEVKETKPNPTIFQLASGKLGHFNPENVLVFEDAFHGIGAANAAGMPSVFLVDNKEKAKENMDKMNLKTQVMITSYEDFDFGSFNWAKH